MNETRQHADPIEQLGSSLLSDLAPQSGDGALLAGVVARALARTPLERRRLRSRRARMLLLAAAVLVAGGAFAAIGALGRTAENRPTQPAHDPSPPDGPERPVLPRPSPVRLSEGPLATARTAVGAPAPAVEHGREPAAGTAVRSLPVVPSAGELFAEANGLRRGGDGAGALRRFEELRRRYPGSREEVTARVLSGNLLLAADPRAALERFEAYPTRDGQIAEEAELGKARALEALGRGAEAREAWQRLLERFPLSVHATEARRRVEPTP